MEHPFEDPTMAREGHLPLPPTIRMIEVKAQFEGYHRWPGAPESVKFLRQTHRHVFHVQVHLQVKHEDRELEFILIKRFLEDNCTEPLRINMGPEDHATLSCEAMAHRIGATLREEYGNRYTGVGVYEDGENGGMVIWER